MAKKIRFPLEMENGVEVRSVEELRDNFSIVRVLGYVKDGKLITWLRDRYANDLADQVEQLDKEDPELPRKICKIIDVEYDENSESELEKDMERLERLKRLKTFSDEVKYEDVIDQIAFEQDEIYDLLDEGVTELYLCGERFSIPVSKEGITYIGINRPIAVIDSKIEINWEEKDITICGMTFDEKYQQILNYSRSNEQKINKEKQIIRIGEYSNKSYLNFMLKSSEQEEAEQMFIKIKGTLEKINYNLDDDIQNTKNIIINAKIDDVASRYISRL